MVSMWKTIDVKKKKEERRKKKEERNKKKETRRKKKEEETLFFFIGFNTYPITSRSKSVLRTSTAELNRCPRDFVLGIYSSNIW